MTDSLKTLGGRGKEEDENEGGDRDEKDGDRDSGTRGLGLKRGMYPAK